MSLVREAIGRQRRGLGDSQTELVPSRRSQVAGSVRVDAESALRQSAVWACLQLRGNLVASTPVDTFRYVGSVQVETPAPALFRMPGGEGVGLPEWLFSTQVDVDRAGNTVGIITEKDGNGLPKTVELQELCEVKIQGEGPRITGYRIGKRTYAPTEIWHEKGFTVPGCPVGLSAITYAAWSIGGYLSAQQFALDWFGVGPHPKGILRNTEQPNIGRKVADEAKRLFKAATQAGDLFVTGSEWEYVPEAQTSAAAAFLEEMKYGAADVCRFFGVPADMVDAGTSGSAITYSNVTQRNLQFLIMHLGPAFVRREWAFTTYAVQQPRFVKFNTDAILRMDPETRSRLLGQQVKDRLLAPSEARALDNRQPFSEDQMAEFDRLFGAPNRKPAVSGATPGGMQ